MIAPSYKSMSIHIGSWLQKGAAKQMIGKCLPQKSEVKYHKKAK